MFCIEDDVSPLSFQVISILIKLLNKEGMEGSIDHVTFFSMGENMPCFRVPKTNNLYQSPIVLGLTKVVVTGLHFADTLDPHPSHLRKLNQI